MRKKHIVIPIFVPHKGCPFDCIYCNQKTISGQIEEMTETKMREVIISYLSTADSSSFVEIGFYGGSFTGIEIEQQNKLLNVANEFVTNKKVNEIRLSTRPDYINHKILQNLKNHNVATIELGVQSLDNTVLKKTFRGHDAQTVYKASKLIKEYGIKLGIQTMIGLPGDTKQKDIETAKKVVKLMPDIVRIYPTLVIKNTYLEKMYKEGLYIPLTLDEAVEICTDLLEIYEKNGIKVQRIGLQPTNTINTYGDVIAGPFHPSIRQLVESKLILKKIEKEIYRLKLYKKDKILIITKDTLLSTVIGQRRGNINYLKDKFNFTDIQVRKSICNDLESFVSVRENID